MGSPFQDGLIKLAGEEETAKEKNEPNIDESMAKMEKTCGLWGDDPTYVNTVE
jgi:hypothetical protein